MWSGRLRLQQYFMAFLASLLKTMRKKKTKGPWGLDSGRREEGQENDRNQSFQREVKGSPADSWTQRTGSGRWSCRCSQRGAPENTWLKPGRGRHLRSSGPSCRIWITWGGTRGDVNERRKTIFSAITDLKLEIDDKRPECTKIRRNRAAYCLMKGCENRLSKISL